MASPPKPWERQGAGPGASAPAISAAAANTTTAPATTAAGAATTTTSSHTTPAIPARPASLTASVNQNAAAYSRPYGATPYGGMGGYGTAYSSPYSSPYSRLGGYGGYGGGMYGSYGGYGGMYGGGMYGGMPGAMPGPADPNNPESLTQRFGMSTQATFQMLEGIVGAFGGLAQMLESTYMATHSSFFAMVSVAEQFGNLRDTLGSVLGIFTLMRWIRTLIAKLTGRPPPVDATALTPAAFARFEGRRSPVPEGGPPKPSRKPLLFFLLAAFGLPYVMSKLIRSMAANVEEEERRRQLVAAQQMLDPSKLEFCRVLYDFSPAAQGQAAVQGVDLEVHKGDLVAVLSKCDPLGNPSEWWKCRARDGGIGYLPSTFLEVLRKPGQPIAAIKGMPESESSRANTMTSSTASPPSPLPQAANNNPPAMPSTKVGDVTVESFQKSQFYS
ncbi:Peroxin 13, N-terminal region-domain-containing protein [Chaetomium strumarium]|uniref:Peroxisomal membrane protein PEX13 n=1 Tax=Chaetomium strumarium TaxID=1170767 RepID=A0AAJ0H1R1_9PEZI|nr:Peroxin 13, N-terminal region-domain-containing protein [Chaetomium strumarium]